MPALVFLTFSLLLVAPCSAQYVRFSPASNPSLCITVTGGANGDSAPLSMAPCLIPTGSYQKFSRTATTTRSAGSLLTIVTGQSAPSAQKCVDLSVDDVVQNDCNPGALSQYWVQSPNPPFSAMAGFYWYTPFLNFNLCLTDRGSSVGVSGCSIGHSQQFWWVGSPDPTVGGSTIMNQQAFSCLQVSGGSNLNGAYLLDAGCTPGAFYQRFNVLDVSAYMGRYQIAGSGKCMDGGINSTPQTTYQYTCSTGPNGATNQQWLQTGFLNDPDSADTYYVDLYSGQCLTWTPTTNAVSATPCTQGNIHQQWTTPATA